MDNSKGDKMKSFAKRFAYNLMDALALFLMIIGIIGGILAIIYVGIKLCIMGGPLSIIPAIFIVILLFTLVATIMESSV